MGEDRQQDQQKAAETRRRRVAALSGALTDTMGALHDSEIEQCLLGALLTDNAAYDDVADIVKPSHFAFEHHQIIYTAIELLLGRGDKANAWTVRHFLKDVEFGRDEYIIALQQARGFPDATRDYAKLVRDYALRRDYVQTVEESLLAIDDTQQHEEFETLRSKVVARLDDLTPDSQGRGLKPLQDMVEGVKRSITFAYETRQRGELVGLSTGMPSVDDFLGGLMPGWVYVIGAGTSIGKTAFALSIALAAARREETAAIFSFEMSAEQLNQRLVSMATGISLTSMLAGKIQGSDCTRALAMADELAALPLHIDESMQATMAMIQAQVRRLWRRRGVDLVIIDYLQLMRSVRARGESRTDELSTITAAIKRMAVLFGVPVLLLSQLNREFSKRDNKRPTLADLRESGSIEQDADVVLFLHREAYYKFALATPDQRDSPPWIADYKAIEKDAEVICAKRRAGPIGTVNVLFDGSRTTFYEEEPDNAQEAFRYG